MNMKTQTNTDWTIVPLDDHIHHYYTSDIDIAAMLVCKDYILVDIAPSGVNKATFIFKNHLNIADAVDGFWSNRIEVHPLEFANNRKNLKTRLFAMKSY